MWAVLQWARLVQGLDSSDSPGYLVVSLVLKLFPGPVQSCHGPMSVPKRVLLTYRVFLLLPTLPRFFSGWLSAAMDTFSISEDSAVPAGRSLNAYQLRKLGVDFCDPTVWRAGMAEAGTQGRIWKLKRLP